MIWVMIFFLGAHVCFSAETPRLKNPRYVPIASLLTSVPCYLVQNKSYSPQYDEGRSALSLASAINVVKLKGDRYIVSKSHEQAVADAICLYGSITIPVIVTMDCSEWIEERVWE